MTSERRQMLFIAGTALAAVAVPFLAFGIFAVGTNRLGWRGDTFIHIVQFGPVRLDGDAVWFVPLLAGSGGLFGALGLLLWAWRAKREERR